MLKREWGKSLGTRKVNVSPGPGAMAAGTLGFMGTRGPREGTGETCRFSVEETKHKDNQRRLRHYLGDDAFRNFCLGCDLVSY